MKLLLHFLYPSRFGSAPISRDYFLLHFPPRGLSFERLKDGRPCHLSNLVGPYLDLVQIQKSISAGFRQGRIAKGLGEPSLQLVVLRIEYLGHRPHSNSRHDPLAEPLRVDVAAEIKRRDQSAKGQNVPSIVDEKSRQNRSLLRSPFRPLFAPIPSEARHQSLSVFLRTERKKGAGDQAGELGPSVHLVPHERSVRIQGAESYVRFISEQRQKLDLDVVDGFDASTAFLQKRVPDDPDRAVRAILVPRLLSPRLRSELSVMEELGAFLRPVRLQTTRTIDDQHKHFGSRERMSRKFRGEGDLTRR